ncbi:MAG TPA: hypothetical protein VEC37_07385 [Bacillota bacterium]|nr:hypothetical protein [Bacillota bacterium]
MNRKINGANWSVVKTTMIDGRIKIGLYENITKVAKNSEIIAGPTDYRTALKSCENYCKEHPGLIKVGFASLLDLRDQLRRGRSLVGNEAPLGK